MTTQDFTAALRIRHPSIDPDEITRRLGLPPLHCWRAGDPRTPPSGERTQSARTETYWVAVLPASPINVFETFAALYRTPLEAWPQSVRTALQSPEFLMWVPLLNMRRDRKFWKQFGEEGGSVEMLINVEQTEGFRLDLQPNLLAMLVDLRIGLSFSVEPAMEEAA
ncbi:MAG TPA: DUF4279 domain-containing protein [Gammaproteobacteria bacterium]|nr:DUF4279 domain-containing protein [Gammaproteobacteria bacterium]